MKKYIEIASFVADALKNNKPVVALESTIIAHGMPYPENVETALNVEKIIYEEGAVPATIAIINGKLKVGLSRNEIELIGKLGKDIPKTNKRDIPYILATNASGATTVSATAYIASLAGIKMFATGGIGGVHRGVEETWDISSDLEELAQTNVNVVCAGIKSILDLSKTLEYLETKGVEVIGYKTDYLPAFYTKASSFKVNHRLDSPEAIASLIKTKDAIGINAGVLITNPIPDEFSMDEAIINQAIETAITEMNKLNLRGKETTPYLLAKVKELTHGDSLHSNIELVYNNARLAAKIAKSLTI